MLPASRSVRRVGSQAWRSWATTNRQNHARNDQADLSPDQSKTRSQSSPTGSAKLFADAEKEDEAASSSREHLRHSQGPVWEGDESTHDAVLRMLVDAHKPLRTGEGVKHDSADKKIKGWMKGLNMEPRIIDKPTIDDGATEAGVTPATAAAVEEAVNPHRTTIPPHLHRPWHSTYTGASQATETPKVKYGTFIKRRADGDALTNLLELQLPPNADGKTRARVREARRSSKTMGRFDKAREGAIDYRLGLGVEGGQLVETEEVEDEDGVFRGNRQVRGSSVLGAQKGSASGLRAWGGLVEDRIQRAKEAGFFKVTKGHGKPLERDPEAGNPHLDTGSLLMNRIVKRQGALPPWIELQNNLDGAVNAFRSTLLTTYTTHLVRTVISTNTLTVLPPLHSVPDHDEAWEARELKFHEENIRQINDLTRRMNAVAPNVARRPVLTREIELSRIRGDRLRDSVWAEVQRRAEEFKVHSTNAPTTGPILWEGDGLTTLRNATRRSLSTLARPLTAVMGRSGGAQDTVFGQSEERGSSSGGTRDPKPLRIAVVVGLGLAGAVYLRRPVQTESLHPPPPTENTSEKPPADRPKEQRLGLIGYVQLWIIEPVSTFFRFLHLVVLFGPVILTTPMIFIGRPPRRRRGKPAGEEEENWGAVWWYGFLVKQMERAGPSFIKLGQWAASRADLFPASLCDRMSKLHSNGDPHSMRHTRRVISAAFGMDFDDIFEHFESKPIGCGAIAQVYRATLKPSVFGDENQDNDAPSTSVAIKVLHPRVRKTVRRDITIMSIFAKAINAFPGMEWLSLPEEVAVFGEMMNSQLDLRVEASNLDRFDRNFRARGHQITFPRPIKLGGDRRESRDVLMEEFEDALPLKHFLRNGGGPYDDRIANIGLDAFLEMLLLDNWTHGDLHPGNIMVRFYKPKSSDFLSPWINRLTGASADTSSTAIPHAATAESDDLVHELNKLANDKDAWLDRLEQLEGQGYAPQLVFIDAGLVTALDDLNRRNFLDLFRAVAEFDGYKAGKLMVERCRTPEHVLDEETFALKIQHLVLSVKSKTFSLAKIKISDILTDVLTAVRTHHVKLEGDFVNTVISILLLEGIGRQLDPNMDLFKSALPILRQLGRQMGTREAISAVPKGNIWAMAKLWVWAEAREVVGEASAVDQWIKYDRLFPNV